MKPLTVSIVGAGPAGLYAALLLKKLGPQSRIRVVERNPAGATYGFGVVLSDRTLSAFRAADAATFAAITAHQASWEAIETYHRGQPVRCGGHTYLGIARKRLLEILQRRCEELGVTVQYQTECTALPEGDLIIGADGVNSLVRSRLAEHLRPSLTPGRSRYIWLGARWAPTAFTFVFHQTGHGLFQAHMYPYDREASTCVLMCGEETWRRAGLDRAGEAESLAFAEELLAPYTGGARFVSNRSLWQTFQTVRCELWSHGNAVLIGDAAHTAHWSIGSGTKLAMEDAIALVQSLCNSESIPAAVARYEAERRPRVERLQQAGRVSERYCEEIERSLGLPPVQFAFQLMTRSGRLDWDELRRRDPGFVAAVAALFGGEPVGAPLKLRGLTLPNRLVSGPEAGIGLPILRPEGFPTARAKAAPDRPLAVMLAPGEAGQAGALARAGCDLICLDSDDPALGEQVRNEAKIPVMLRAPSVSAANTLVAGARADLCLMAP